MSEDQIVQDSLPELETGIDSVDTVNTESETSLPESPEEIKDPEPKEEKLLTQEQFDRELQKRLARERRKFDREYSEKIAQAQREQLVNNPPSLDEFNSAEEYAEALAIVKAEEILARRQSDQHERDATDSFKEKQEEIKSKYDDYDQVVGNENLPITQMMAVTIRDSEIGPEIAYFLGTNVKEAERISRLPGHIQAKELGKIELKLTDNPPVKRVTSAPTPITPVLARGSNNSSYDTTDPRSIKQLSMDEWAEARKQRLIKQAKGL
jgi:hypothetical protein